jgi:hypothetical protein
MHLKLLSLLIFAAVVLLSGTPARAIDPVNPAIIPMDDVWGFPYLSSYDTVNSTYTVPGFDTLTMRDLSGNMQRIVVPSELDWSWRIAVSILDDINAGATGRLVLFPDFLGSLNKSDGIVSKWDPALPQQFRQTLLHRALARLPQVPAGTYRVTPPTLGTISQTSVTNPTTAAAMPSASHRGLCAAQPVELYVSYANGLSGSQRGVVVDEGPAPTFDDRVWPLPGASCRSY